MINADELTGYDAIAQAELVRQGAVTPIELVDAAIARIEQVNPILNALGSSRNIIVPLSRRDGRNVHKPLWQPRQPLPSLFQRGHGFLG